MVWVCFETGKLRSPNGCKHAPDNVQNPFIKWQRTALRTEKSGESRSSPRETQNYVGRISGPLLDRSICTSRCPKVQFRESPAIDREDSGAHPRPRGGGAANVSRPGQGPAEGHLHARMGSRDLKQFCKLDAAILELLKFAMADLNLSARPTTGWLKWAATIADLAAPKKSPGNTFPKPSSIARSTTVVDVKAEAHQCRV